MATYLKRTSKLFDLSLSRASGDVNLRDLMCPVCRGILIEPVTLPCTHNLCLRCLKGTFEHNSLSCPLCRVRVGSWLRTATKSETLVNTGLWELIRAKFPKEVEDKHNGDDRDIGLDAGFTTNKILSAAGEIRREYEAQLRMAKEEIRCQREAEQVASEALIRKIQAEEQQQQLAQLAQDQLFAKTLAKKQVVEKQKEVAKCYSEYPTASVQNCSFETSKFNVAALTELGIPKPESQGLESGKMNLLELRESSELRRSNIALISKIRAERYASSMKAGASGVYKDSSVKFCCQKPIPVYNAITRTLKHQTVTKVMQPCTSNYSSEPGCSTSKIYGTQSKEELHIPNDVVNSKKKSLGVEVCMTLGEDDERIGSAESAGSHDSINQEIHHFKPIKAMPRTPLKISTDGRQIDPKLIRVVPILKRTSSAVPKPPSQAHIKKIIGCSWSAFRGKARQGSRENETVTNPESTIETDQKPSTSYNQPQIISNKSSKPQTYEAIRRLGLVPEVSFDSNKNYAKNVNRIINGTKVSKKLSLEEPVEVGKVHKSWKTHVRNGMVAKCKRQKNAWIGKKDGKPTIDAKDGNDAEASNSISSSASAKPSPNYDEQREHLEDEAAIENIAERIKRRKVNAEKKNLHVANTNSEVDNDVKRSARKRLCGKEDEDREAYETYEASSTAQKRVKTKPTRTALPRAKRQTARRTTQNSVQSPDKSDSLAESNCGPVGSGVRKSARNLKHANNSSIRLDQDATCEKISGKCQYSVAESCEETQECISENNNATEAESTTEKSLSDDDAIKEQQRIERLVLQEKEDFELAQRLQAKFDEMERIAGRTRRSRKAIESASIEVDLYKIEVGRTVENTTGAHTAKRSIVNQTMSSEAKKRGRPPKRVK